MLSITTYHLQDDAEPVFVDNCIYDGLAGGIHASLGCKGRFIRNTISQNDGVGFTITREVKPTVATVYDNDTL